MRILSCLGGHVVLPDRALVLVDRADGGNLIVNPPREVWERSQLTRDELMHWSFLVAATGRAMIDVLPQLADGCVNYWEAGNWALDELAAPVGPKVAPRHRRVHLHLLGRSPNAKSAHYRWGEAPKFPDYVDRHAWAADHRRLTGEECALIVTRATTLLGASYGMAADLSVTCGRCGYPTPSAEPHACDS
jgi:hypothetical protein